ncbi:hypothetical protein N7532_001872 [Penicillium argentinense]|uniref:MADS-box domain-containing protein n=1 Tax=Penicillium argentinense TaxID=1131581 RepID=A0A9W9G4X5_9EURO|nr:uncharacterized protein N7532_001872 [Penicillium argentinense]KAJ5111337.1 hypothetical protein N7532_001872 [Penicillium argentinense]
MGRRKIEIKAIKDDRNRSVTFLKRKGGLFKKAHELAVLCSVDVAVIIFGHNKKLYEYSSCDMPEALGRYQYFGPPHEHKGPDDFAGKREDDDEDDEATPAPEDLQAVQQGPPAVPPHLHQTGFQHINHAPSASPPIPNGMTITRHGTPQSQSLSRPSSRNHIRRVSSNLGPHQHGTPPPPPPAPQNGFAYMPNPSMYNPNVHSAMGQSRPGQYQTYGHPHPPPAPQGTPPQTMHHPHGLPPQPMQPHQGPQHFQHPHAVGPPPMGMPPGSHAPVQQVTQAYMPDQGRGSMPPSYGQENQQDRAAPVPENSQDNAPGVLKPEQSQSPPQPKSFSKSRSIFTPIDDRGSVLARHFGGAPMYESPRAEPKTETSQENSPKLKPPAAPVEPPRASSTPDIKPPSRTNSGPLTSKRPVLKVQIPSENSDQGSATAGSSSRDSAGNKTVTPAKDNPPAGGVVLPPPSPSAGAILSAGAQGPPNPFARPPPPGTASQNNSYGNTGNNNSGNNSTNIETPLSALPSRFVSDNLLPSPSSFFPEWGFGRTGPDSNLLPSPLTFPTPALQSGPSFAREDEQDKKRKTPDSGPSDEGASKKPKT